MAPQRVGLYNPAFEHDSCGVAMVVDMHGRRSRNIVDKAITALVNLEHRGAQGAEPHSGDGAGILIQVPDDFFRQVVDFDLPEAGSYATGIAFLPQSSKDATTAAAAVEKIVEAEGLQVLGWRERTHRRVLAGGAGPRRDADLPPAVHRRRRRHAAGASRLRHPQTCRARTRHQGSRPGRPRARNRLLPKPFRPDHGLQGHADHAAAQGVLP